MIIPVCPKVSPCLQIIIKNLVGGWHASVMSVAQVSKESYLRMHERKIYFSQTSRRSFYRALLKLSNFHEYKFE